MIPLRRCAASTLFTSRFYVILVIHHNRNPCSSFRNVVCFYPPHISFRTAFYPSLSNKLEIRKRGGIIFSRGGIDTGVSEKQMDQILVFHLWE